MQETLKSTVLLVFASAIEILFKGHCLYILHLLKRDFSFVFKSLNLISN